MPRHTRGLAAAALLLGGCTVTPPVAQQPDFRFDVPSAWGTGEAGAQAPADRWWARFDSASLARTVDLALAANYDIAAAAGRLDVALAEARIAGADLYPQVSGSLNAARQRTNFSGSGLPGVGAGNAVNRSTTSNFGVSLDVSWELDVWGRVRSATRGAIADVQAAQADFAGARLSIAGQAAKAWLAVTEARLQAELAAATVENYRATARQATDRVEKGVQPPSDMHLALSNLASAEALLQQRRQTQDAAQRQLDALLARYPDGTFEGAAVLPELSPLPPVGVPAEVIARRPDLVVAERRLAASMQRVDAAQAARYPRIALTASGGTSSDEFDRLLSGDNIIWNIAGNLIQPIFEGGRLKARVDAADGQTNEVLAIFAQQVLDAFVEVETALRAEALLSEREGYLRVAAEQARLAVAVSENRYGQGIESFIVVLESQRRALDAQSAALSVRRLRLENRVDLHLSLGGGFEESMPVIPTAASATSEDNR